MLVSFLFHHLYVHIVQTSVSHYVHYRLDLNVSSFPAVSLLCIKYYRNYASNQPYITSVNSQPTFQNGKITKKANQNVILV